MVSIWSKFQECYFSFAHSENRVSIEFMETLVIHLEFLRDLSHFLEINKLTIVEPSLMHVINNVLFVYWSSFALFNNQLND